MGKDDCKKIKPCETCDLAGACSSNEKKEHEKKRLQEKLFHIRHKIMVMSGKGGVGKSTVTTNLAASLALRGYEVGVLDADLHGPDLPRMLGIESQHLKGRQGSIDPVLVFKGLRAVSMALFGRDPNKAIVWRGPAKHTAIKQFLGQVNWGDLDFLLIDLPPGTGDEPLSVAKLVKDVDGVIIVTTPQDVALLDSRKAVSFSRQIEVPVFGIVENMSGMVCPHCHESIDLFKIGGGERTAGELGVSFLGRIPIDPLVVAKCDSGEPFVVDSIDSEAKAAFAGVTRRVLEAVESTKEDLARAPQ